MPPRFHATPPAAVAETVLETVVIDGHAFHIERPSDSDRILNHQWTTNVFSADEYVPYWPVIWPAARMLAEAVVREPWGTYPQPVTVLDVGCGLGLAGIACLARGLAVTFSDLDETALAFAAANARRNGFHHGFGTKLIDFRCPPNDRRYAVIIGSDLMYEERLVSPLVGLLSATLAPDGVCLVTDPDRTSRRAFECTLRTAGYGVTITPVCAGEPGGLRTNGTLYRIQRA